MRTFAAPVSRCAAIFTTLAVSLAAADANHNWKDYNGGPDSSKYVALTAIDKKNVKDLQVAWTYPSYDEMSYLFNPLIVDNVMYVLARNNSLVALDATTGKEIWIHENLRGIAPRGINYWESKDRKDRRLLFQMNSFLQAIDARTGKSILSFGEKGLVNLREGLGRDPKRINRIQSGTPGKVFENLLLLGSATGEGYMSSPGHLRAYDVITGKLVWTFHTIPHPGEYGYDTWPKDAWQYAGGANTWAEFTIDEKRGIAYFPTGSPTYDFYGADRVGSNLFANCLIALDARTGKRLWHYQVVHHDLWDYDLVAAPQLITVRHGGKTIDAVAQTSKHGFLFVFDRVTGEPLWPIEERPVPKSDVPGEQSWPTQPFPTAPPPFARQKMTVADINPYLLTPEERASWKDRIASGLTGLFTPMSLEKELIALPGARGGSNWGTTAANPDKGLVYVLTQDWPSVYKLSPEPPGAGRAPRGDRGNQEGQATYDRTCAACHGADRRGSPSVPSLVGIAGRFTLADFRQVVVAGKGKMPAFPSLGADAVAALFAHLGTLDGMGPGRGGFARAPRNVDMPPGPVVASGGAPGGQNLAPTGFPGGGMGGPPYPEGLEAPSIRYYTDYGLDYPYIISPPWSSIVAYDLNKGTIKWKVPLGEDAAAVKQGARNTGTFAGGERRGPIVTASGLLFVATEDGKVRAYDEDTGEVLWTAPLPAASEGVPAMYSVNGRQYLVICATTPISFGGRRDNTGVEPAASGPVKGYVAFALPEKPKAAAAKK